jgi:hydrogenase nickel incorporation protein HypA/HybF
MHEQSLMNDLMAKIDALVKENNAKKAVAIDVWCGALSHMSKDHFKEHFDESSPGTSAEGARLNVEVSEDINDPNAQQILLKNIEVED